MGNNSIYVQFTFYILGIAANIFGIYVAQRWLVATRRRENEIKAIKGELSIHREYLIERGILPAGLIQTPRDH